MLASDVLSVGASAVTLTASSMAPTSSTMARSRVSLIWTQLVLDVLLEARELDRDLVGAGEQVVDLEQALLLVVAETVVPLATSVTVTDAPGIGAFVDPDSAGDPPACLLRLQGRREEETRQCQNHRERHVTG